MLSRPRLACSSLSGLFPAPSHLDTVLGSLISELFNACHRQLTQPCGHDRTAEAQKKQADARGGEVEELTQELQKMSQQSNAELEELREQLEQMSQLSSTSRTIDQMSQQTTIDAGSRFLKDSDSIVSAPSMSETASHPRAPLNTPPSTAVSLSASRGFSDVGQREAEPLSGRKPVPPPVQISLNAQGVAASAPALLGSGAESARSAAPASQRSFLSSDTIGWQDNRVQGLELEEESWSRHGGSEVREAFSPQPRASPHRTDRTAQIHTVGTRARERERGRALEKERDIRTRVK
eukprot:903001-Rhodomonas_salina.1